MKKPRLAVLAVATIWASQSLAQSLTPISNDDFSKETENPITRQITLPLRYEADFQMVHMNSLSLRSKSIRQWCHFA